MKYILLTIAPLLLLGGGYILIQRLNGVDRHGLKADKQTLISIIVVGVIVILLHLLSVFTYGNWEIWINKKIAEYKAKNKK
jgi:hypothetical protein